MDKELLSKRIDAIEVFCAVLQREPFHTRGNYAVSEAYIDLPVRRVLELVDLARLGLEFGRDGDFDHVRASGD